MASSATTIKLIGVTMGEFRGAAQLCVPSLSASMHYHDEIRIGSGLITNAIIRDDEGRARRQ
jgi:hypothetical protein